MLIKNYIKNSVFVFTIFLCVTLSSRQSSSEEKQIGLRTQLPYPTIEEIYNDCKISVNLAENDMEGFLHTGCARQLNGVYNGLFIILSGFIPVDYPNDQCKSVRDEWYNSISNRICFEAKQKIPKNKPIELQMAQDLVSFIDIKYLKDGNITSKYLLKELPSVNLAPMFMEIYKCDKKTNRGEKNVLDN